MIPHNIPFLGEEEKKIAERIISSGLISQGLEVSGFESDLCDFFGLPQGHAVVVSSGSSALYLALWSLNGKDKRVGVPVYSCASLRNATGMLGAKTVFLDCDDDSPNLSIKHADQKDIEILMAPSMFGIPIELPTVRNYKVIEDLAQSLGAEIDGERIGLRGDIGICSFYATKMITSGGQGGAVISRDKKLIDSIRDYREFDCRDDNKLRFNFQMTDLQAAIGRVQLKKLPTFIKQREKWFKIYREIGLNLIENKLENHTPVRYRIVHKCNNPKKIIDALAKEEIKAIVPIEEYELLDKSKKYLSANLLSRSTVSLPAHLHLKEEDIFRIGSIVKKNC
jgi:perosamine synthetase